MKIMFHLIQVYFLLFSALTLISENFHRPVTVGADKKNDTLLPELFMKSSD